MEVKLQIQKIEYYTKLNLLQNLRVIQQNNEVSRANLSWWTTSDLGVLFTSVEHFATVI